jgi:hypothetical protein
MNIGTLVLSPMRSLSVIHPCVRSNKAAFCQPIFNDPRNTSEISGMALSIYRDLERPLCASGLTIVGKAWLGWWHCNGWDTEIFVGKNVEG